jgi:hypothetical protein
VVACAICCGGAVLVSGFGAVVLSGVVVGVLLGAVVVSVVVLLELPL